MNGNGLEWVMVFEVPGSSRYTETFLFCIIAVEQLLQMFKQIVFFILGEGGY